MQRYDSVNEDGAVAEDEAVFKDTTNTLMEVSVCNASADCGMRYVSQDTDEGTHA